MNVNKIIKALEKNQIIAIPTDTVYGFFAKVSKENIHKLNSLKNSQLDKKLTLMSSDVEKFESLLKFTPYINSILKSELPGKITFIIDIKDKEFANKNLTWNDNLGIRVPSVINKNTKFLLKVLDKYDFLLSTSVNLTSRETLNNFKEIKKTFGDDVYVVKNLEKLDGKSSKIIQFLENDLIKIIRR